MTFDNLASTARLIGRAISLTVDPTAEDSERWIASVGLDASGAGPTPSAALIAGLEDARAALDRRYQPAQVAAAVAAR